MTLPFDYFLALYRAMLAGWVGSLGAGCYPPQREPKSVDASDWEPEPGGVVVQFRREGKL